jgi:uncharacterized protein
LTRVGGAPAAFGALSDVTSPAAFVQNIEGRPRPAEEPPMPTPQRQVAVITLGVGDLARSRRFYSEGFGWEPTFANDEIVFYQMNGCVLATWLATALAADMRRPTPSLGLGGAFALAHNVATQGEVQPLLDRLAQFGGTLLRPGDAPPHGGFRGYVADPDGHAWEIAWNPAWPISPEGYVTFGV